MNKKKWIILGGVIALLLVLSLALGGLNFAGGTEQNAQLNNVATENGENTNEPGKETAAPESDDNAEDQPQETEDDNTGITVTTPDGEQSDASASLGVVEGEGTKDLEEGDATQQSTQPTQPSQPAEQPATGTIDPETIDLMSITYEQYHAMSAEDQQIIINMFGSSEDFVKWYNVIKAIYEAENPGIEIGDGTVVDGSQLGGK